MIFFKDYLWKVLTDIFYTDTKSANIIFYQVTEIFLFPFYFSNIIFCIVGIVLVCFLYLVNFLFAYFNIGWHFDICQSVYYKIKP